MSGEAVTVTQADRDAAADAVLAYRDQKNGNWQARIRAGECDGGVMVQAFARRSQSDAATIADLTARLAEAEGRVTRLREALTAWADAQQASDDAVEHIERAAAEGWYSDPSGAGWIADSQRRADAAWEKATALRQSALSDAVVEAREAWQPIETAKKDGTPIWALFHPSIYPELRPQREDLERWNGLQACLRHPGVADDGFDIGWNMAAPVGQGGFPDAWIVGWRPLPAALATSKGGKE